MVDSNFTSTKPLVFVLDPVKDPVVKTEEEKPKKKRKENPKNKEPSVNQKNYGAKLDLEKVKASTKVTLAWRARCHGYQNMLWWFIVCFTFFSTRYSFTNNHTDHTSHVLLAIYCNVLVSTCLSAGSMETTRMVWKWSFPSAPLRSSPAAWKPLTKPWNSCEAVADVGRQGLCALEILIRGVHSFLECRQTSTFYAFHGASRDMVSVWSCSPETLVINVLLEGMRKHHIKIRYGK